MVALGYHQSHDEIVRSAHHLDPSHRRSSQSSLAVVIYMMCATVSGMLLYGVIKGRPSYLMPFFWIQLCDFFFSLPSFLTSLYATPGYNNQHWDAQAVTVPNTHTSGSVLDVKRIWPSASTTTLYTSSLIFTAAVLLFKGYFLCVVWKCYRYLKMREMILPLHLPYSSNHGTDIMIPPGFLAPPPMPIGAMAAPPDYETATKSNAPPDYEAACRQAVELKNPAPETPPPICLSTEPNAISAESVGQVTVTFVQGPVQPPLVLQVQVQDNVGASGDH